MEQGKPLNVLGSILFDCSSIKKKSRRKFDRQSMYIAGMGSSTRVLVYLSTASTVHGLIIAIYCSKP